MSKSPLYDTNLSNVERAKWIVSQLTIEEKLASFTGHPAVERLGLPMYWFGGEAAHGLQQRGGEGRAPHPSTSFPQPIGMAASFDQELMKKVGDVVGTEVRAFYNVKDKIGGIYRWAPTIDLCRDPRWGRNEEGYGEDPYLTGKLAGAYIEGMQDEHNYDGSPLKPGERGDRIRMGATLKHFYANNVEYRRCYDSFEVSEKVKYDYELEPYRYCIEESHAEGAMTCYNEINGIPGNLNHEVQDVLKDKWGMNYACTDGGDFLQTVNFHHYYETHAEAFAECVKAGVDQMLDSPVGVHDAAVEAWNRGLITEEELDKSLICLFAERIRGGAFDEKDPYEALGEANIGSEEAAAVSLKIAEENIVLLKNDNGFLPLEKSDDIALIGPVGDKWYQDWYGGEPMYRKTLKNGLEERSGKAVPFEAALDKIILKCGDRYVGAEKKEDPALILVDNRVDAVVFEHTNWGCGSNFLYAPAFGKYVILTDEGPLKIASKDPFEWFIKESLTIAPKGAEKLPNPKNANLMEFDRYWEDADEEICIYGFGARVIFAEDGVLTGGDLSAKKKQTATLEGNNTVESYQREEREPAVFTVETVDSGIERAKALAKAHRKVVLALGCNPMVNAKEEIDRSTIAFIPAQERLLEAVLSVNPDAAVVLMTNYPYEISKMNELAPAILLSATGSQDMGSGIASALFGDSTPAGRLPMTWYLSDADLPDMTDYDLIQNPRTYRYFDKPVLYPFGYGLTYSDFELSGLQVEKTDCGKLKISVTVKNTGDAAADEVVEIYLKRLSGSATVHPKRRLISFARVHALKPGEEASLTLYANPSDLAIYMEDLKEKKVESGTYLVYAGKHALDEALQAEIEY